MHRHSILYLIGVATLSWPAACWADDVETYSQQPGSVGMNSRLTAAQSVKSGALQAGVKDDASINPSVQLIPFQREAPKPSYVAPKPFAAASSTPAGDGPEQFRVGVRSGPPLPGAVQYNSLSNPTRLSGSNFAGTHPSMFGTIPPISSYVHTPGNSVINYGVHGSPGGNLSAGAIGGPPPVILNTAPTHYRTVGRGVTVLESDLAVSSVQPAPQPPGSRLPGMPVSRMQPPPANWNTSALLRGSSTALQASASPYIPTRGGITALPGYEVSYSAPGVAKQTLGGRWSAGSAAAAAPASLSAVAGALPRTKMFAQAVPVPVSYMARPGLLSSISANQKVADWPTWYKVVANAIYSHWQTLDVCPGIAHLEVTVQAGHDVSGRVTDFTPAPDIERNTAAETQFRETAVGAVDHVGYFEVPDFPTKTKAVVFDIDLKRTVDGPTGVTVVGASAKK
jgi:hypothetical protein